MPDSATPDRRRRRLRRGLRYAAVGALAAAATFAALCWMLLSGQFGVDLMVRELVARSGGTLEIEGATGAFIDTVRVSRIVWRGPTATAIVTDAALTWKPAALWSQGIVVHGLGAQRLELDYEASDSDAVPLPASLALPVELTIERLAIGRLDWRVGTGRGTLRGVAFGYSGGAREHRVSDLALAADFGAMTGGFAVGSAPPFPVDSRLAFRGDASLHGGEADVSLSGTLASLAVVARGRAGAARFEARGDLEPFAAVSLRGLALEAGDIDLAAWDPALPATRIAVVARAQPSPGGLSGTIEATNALPGAIDARRIPVRSASSRFAWSGDALRFDEIRAELPGGAKLAGHGEIPLAGGPAGAWSLDVRDVDLRQFYAPLVATRLAGRIAADLGARRQKFSADLADRGIAGGIALAFAGTVADDTLVIESFRARAGPGELAGRGRLALSGERGYALAATATHLDPARFGAYPRGTLDATFEATGVLAPNWRSRMSLALGAGSRLAGVALSGTASGTLGRDFLDDGAIDLHVASATLAMARSEGPDGGRITARFDAPRLAELLPLLPAAVPRTLSGALQVTAELRGAVSQAGIDIVVKGDALKLGTSLALRTLAAQLSVAPATNADIGTAFASRELRLDVEAKDVVAPQGSFASARASVSGTLAGHAIAVAFTGGDVDVEAKAHGGLAEPASAPALSALAWSGVVDSLESRGPWALRLAAPATLSIAAGHVRVGETQLAVADGNVSVAELAWDDGRITTRGRFAGVPAATAARLAGRPLPFPSTLTLGGEWSLTAAPRLNGSFALRREGGDLWVVRDAAVDATKIALGVTDLEASARFTDDAVEAKATFRSTRGGSADAALSIGALADAAPGRIALDAPLALTASAQLPTLQLLQPWIGTAAVIDGRARMELQAKGTVKNAPFAGTLTGEALRLDAPRYGLHFTDGRVSARFADRGLILDDLSLTAGAGVVHATGTIAAASADGRTPAGHLTWRADRFRVVNRPEYHLVVSGEGTVASVDGRIALAGSLRADEGGIVYDTDPGTTLGDDVVVKGWPRPTADATRATDIPLAVDLALDLGDKLRFTGMGLDTGLRGEVRVTNGASGFVGKGSIRAVNGTYFAFGQRLVIDPGRLVFDGPLDNPGLDIIALRKNYAVEAGVAVTGTVKVPNIQLTSNPPVPDSEKLSWLVLGHGLDRTSGAEVAALQAASAALLGRNSRPVTSRIAESLGVDDISFRSSAGTSRGAARGGPNAEGQVVAVGKRLSDKLAIVYEQGLTVATNALRLEYSLTGSLTLRAEAGTISGVGLYFRRNFD